PPARTQDEFDLSRRPSPHLAPAPPNHWDSERLGTLHSEQEHLHQQPQCAPPRRAKTARPPAAPPAKDLADLPLEARGSQIRLYRVVALLRTILPDLQKGGVRSSPHENQPQAKRPAAPGGAPKSDRVDSPDPRLLA